MTRIVYAAAYLQLSFDASLFARLRSAASAFGNSVGNDIKATQASVFFFSSRMDMPSFSRLSGPFGPLYFS